MWSSDDRKRTCGKRKFFVRPFSVPGQINRRLTEWPGRDVFSDGLPVMGCIRSVEIIPEAQKSQTEMHSVGRNNPCGAKESDRDASGRSK